MWMHVQMRSDPPGLPHLLLDCTQTACPVHTKSIHFWPIINKISHMDNSNSLCQQHNLRPRNALFETHTAFSRQHLSSSLTHSIQIFIFIKFWTVRVLKMFFCCCFFWGESSYALEFLEECLYRQSCRVFFFNLMFFGVFCESSIEFWHTHTHTHTKSNK